jgi:hypothetical protein
MSALTHFDAQGQAHMVDVAAKAATHRIAVASGRIEMLPATLALIEAGNAKKGDVLGIARIAGIMAAKKTSDLIPLCHPLALTRVAMEFEAASARQPALQAYFVPQRWKPSAPPAWRWKPSPPCRWPCSPSTTCARPWTAACPSTTCAWWKSTGASRGVVVAAPLFFDAQAYLAWEAEQSTKHEYPRR